jgi:hypothetical protein
VGGSGGERGGGRLVHRHDDADAAVPSDALDEVPPPANAHDESLAVVFVVREAVAEPVEGVERVSEPVLTEMSASA